MGRFSSIELSRSRRKDIYAEATGNEIADYRSLDGTLMYLGTSVLPQASLATSLMQKRINCWRVAHIVEASMLRDIMMLKPELRFPSIGQGFAPAVLVSFPDAVHGGKEFDYGQTGLVTKLHVSLGSERTGGLFYGISYTSGKKRLISHYYFGAEIIAAADPDEIG